MTCRELTDFLMDYLSDELPAAVRGAFDHHLALCPNCVIYLESYRFAIRAGKTAYGGEGQDEALPEDLVQAILAARRDAL
jgi:anti-sigma factor RsiW